MKSLHLFSSPRTTLLFCGIYFCFTIILSPLSDSQFSIFDIQFIVFQYQNGVNQGLLEVCNNCCAATRWIILPFDEITLDDEELVEVEFGEVGILLINKVSY